MFYYGLIRFLQLFGYEDTDVMLNIQENYFSYNYTFDSDDGLNFAFGITEYDGNPEPIDDPTYGKLSARYETWGEGNWGSFADIPLRNCSAEELGLVKGKED